MSTKSEKRIKRAIQKKRKLILQANKKLDEAMVRLRQAGFATK